MPIVDIAGKPLYYLSGSNGGALSSFYGEAAKIIDSGYVNDGLELWLDGEFNAGKHMHEETPTVWKDLSSNGFDFTLNAVTVSDKAMVFNGSTSFAKCDDDALRELLSGLKDRTVEIVCKFNNTASAQVVFLGEGNTATPEIGAAGLWYRPSSGGFKVGTWDNSPAVKSDKAQRLMSYSTVYDNDKLNDFGFYQNNVSLTQDATAGNMYNSALSIGARLKNDGSTWQYFFNGEICCIRVYSRKLSDRERYYNYLVDKMRFGLKADNELTVMTFNVQNWTGLNADEELMNSIFRKYNPDVAGFQEYNTAKSLGGVSVKDYLNDIWEFVEVGVPSSRTYSKAVVSHRETSPIETVDFTQLNPNAERRSYHKTYIEVNGKKIAVFNTHLDVSASRSTENVQYKVLQSRELCEIVAKEEYFILLGDFNTTCMGVYEDDYVNQLKPFVDAGFHLANCSEFGFDITWYATSSKDGEKYPTDNIITSANITINDAVVDYQKADNNPNGQILDHMPLIAYLTVN